MSPRASLGRDLRPEQVVELMRTPGGRMKFLRHTKEMTQVTLAKTVHVTQSAVSQWEKDLWLPDTDRQHDIADALGSTRSFIFGDRVHVAPDTAAVA